MADGSWLKGCRGDGGETKGVRVRWRVERFFLLLLLTILFFFLRFRLTLFFALTLPEREGHHEVSSLLEHLAGFLSLLVLSSLVQRQLLTT